MRRMRRERSGPKPNQTHPRATTTPDIRRAIQASDERTSVLARRYGVSRKTVAKWRGRATTADERMGPKQPLSCISTLEDEAVVLAYRWCTCLSLNGSSGEAETPHAPAQPRCALSMSGAPWAQQDRSNRQVFAAHKRRPQGTLLLCDHRHRDWAGCRLCRRLSSPARRRGGYQIRFCGSRRPDP